MIPETMRYNVESVAAILFLPKSPYVHLRYAVTMYMVILVKVCLINLLTLLTPRNKTTITIDS